VTSRGLLRHADFLKLWSAETISVFGTAITQLALPLVAAVTLEVSPLEFGLLTTIEFLPFILLSLPAGVWVDRLRRRPILIAGDLGRAVTLGSIPVAYAFDALTIWQLYVVAFLTGCLTVFFDVAYQSYLPSLVDREQLVDGNAKLEISRSAAQIAGPGLAGVLVAVLRAPFAILLDAASYVIAALLLLAIRRPEPPVAPAEASSARPSVRREVSAGLRYVLGNPWLRSIAATTGTSNLFTNMQFAILVLFLVRRGFSAEQIGFAFSIGSVGFLLAALTTNRLTARLGVGRMLLLSAIGFSISGLAIAAAPDSLLFVAVAGSGFLAGYCSSAWNINQVSLRQAITPPRMQGRMNATMRFVVWGTIPIGSTLGAILAQLVGLHETLWIGAIGGLVAFLPVAFSPVRMLVRMPEAQAEPAAAAGPA
jgi:MFS family permease